MTARKSKVVKSEDSPPYKKVTAAEDLIVAQALAILEARMRKSGFVVDGPTAARDFCALKLGALAHEVFSVMFLDAQHKLIEFEEMFRGTLTQTSVYPREVVKTALKHNCAAVILAHNHPSGLAEPSRADEQLTTALQQALALVDVRVLDHLVVAGVKCTSFAERGLL